MKKSYSCLVAAHQAAEEKIMTRVEVVPAMIDPTVVVWTRQLIVKQISPTDARIAAERHFMESGENYLISFHLFTSPTRTPPIS